MNSLLAAPVIAMLVSSSAPMPSVMESITASEARLSGTTQVEEGSSVALSSLQDAAGEEAQATTLAAPSVGESSGMVQLMDPGQGASGMVALDDAMAGASGLSKASTMAAMDDMFGGASTMRGASMMVARDLPGSSAGAMPMMGSWSSGARGMATGFGWLVACPAGCFLAFRRSFSAPSGGRFRRLPADVGGAFRRGFYERGARAAPRAPERQGGRGGFKASPPEAPLHPPRPPSLRVYGGSG